jgi:hypothetical protein
MSTDLESQIHSYGTQLVDSQAPITDADIADLLAKVRHLPPTPVRVYPKSRLRIAVAAGIAVVVLFGVVSLLTVTSETDGPPATTPPPVVTTTNLEGIVTPPDPAVSVVPGLGTLTWQRVDGDENTIPPGIQADPDGGYISFEGSKLWRSDDGITWTVEEWPPEFEGFDRIEIDDGWAIARGLDASQLFERDGDSWVPVQFGLGPLPQTTGITWFQNPRVPVESGGVTVSSGSVSGRISLGYVYGLVEIHPCESEPCDQEPNVRWDVASETVRVTSPDERGASIAVLSMVVEGQTISFVDTGSGEIVHTITGSADYPADVIADQLRRNVGFTYQPFPWESAAEVLAVPDGGFAAYEIVYDREGNPEAPIERSTMWMSSDGRDWVSKGELPFLDASAEHIFVRERPTQILAVVFTGFDGPLPVVGRTWASSDGVTWSQVDLPFPSEVVEQKTDFGWVAGESEHWFQFWVSTDGVTWLEVEVPPARPVPGDNANGNGYTNYGAAGSLMYGAVGNDIGSRLLWIGTFEPTP